MSGFIDAFCLFSISQDYREKPDYARCVAIVASASLREMIKPGALAIASPIVVGRLCFFAFIAGLNTSVWWTYNIPERYQILVCMGL